jgi:uncharacterized NAD-dependent epimerase/dehydratase family protein
LTGQHWFIAKGAFNTPNGKTAHGLVRFTERYEVLGVIDSNYAGQDAGEVLDGKPAGILIFDTLKSAVKAVGKPTYFVIGLAPDGGRLPKNAWKIIFEAANAGMNIDSGLHDFLSNSNELMAINGEIETKNQRHQKNSREEMSCISLLARSMKLIA